MWRGIFYLVFHWLLPVSLTNCVFRSSLFKFRSWQIPGCVVWGGIFPWTSSKLSMLEQSVQGMCGQGDPLWAGVCDGMAVRPLSHWGQDGVPFHSGQVLRWGALAVTDPDTGAVFEDEPDPDTGTVFEDEPLMDFTIRQIFRVSLQAGFSRHLPATSEKGPLSSPWATWVGMDGPVTGWPDCSGSFRVGRGMCVSRSLELQGL